MGLIRRFCVAWSRRVAGSSATCWFREDEMTWFSFSNEARHIGWQQASLNVIRFKLSTYIKTHTMRTCIVLFLGATIFTGCSKSSSPEPQATTPTNAASAAAFMTNTLDVLQARYQEDDRQIREVQAQLDLLRRKYNITDKSPTQLDETNQNGEMVVSSQQPYWDAKRKLAAMIAFQLQLAAKIETDKFDAQLKAQGTH